MSERANRKTTHARSVGYSYHLPDGRGFSTRSIFNESTMETLLLKAVAAGTIKMFDTGRGAVVWFYGKPGPKLRSLRSRVLALLPDGVEPFARV